MERQLAALWQQFAGDSAEADAAVWRTRVANLLVFVTTETLLDDAQQMLRGVDCRTSQPRGADARCRWGNRS